MTRYEQPLSPMEIRWHGALAAALRLDREWFTFSWLERGMERVFPSYGPRSNFDFQHDVDPRESAFFSVCCSLHVINWESVGNRARITYSKEGATWWLNHFCTDPTWVSEGGAWDPDVFRQIVQEIRTAAGER